MPFPAHIADIQPFVELNVSAWASVYKAYQPSLDRVVLLKVLNPRYSKDEKNAAWFTSEAQLTAKVIHPNVVSVYGFGESKDGLYFTTEFIDGITLRDVIDRGPVPAPIAVYILEQLLLGLQAAHKQGVLHRDIKPENILLSLEGHVKLCDFGFASLLDTSLEQHDVRGTLGYIAPESILQGRSDEKSDLFALGTVLFEMITGTVAYFAIDAEGYVERLQHHDPVSNLNASPFIPESLVAVCKQLIQKNPDDRVASASKALEKIRQIQKAQHWQVTAEQLSLWWENPDSYNASQVLLAEEGRIHVHPESMDQHTAFRKWVWGISIGLVAILATIAFVNGIANKPDLPGSETSERGEMGSMQASLAVPDSVSTQVHAVKPERTIPELPAEPSEHEQPGDAEISIDDQDEVKRLDALRTSSAPDTALIVPDKSGQGLLTVLCVPSCSVNIDNIEKGTAPPAMTVPLNAGTYQVQLNHPDFPPFVEEVDVVDAGNDTLRISLWATVGTLDLKVSPWGEVFIDSTSYGVFPPGEPLRIWPGEHTLRVVHSELGEREESFTIGANETLTRTITFTNQDNDP